MPHSRHIDLTLRVGASDCAPQPTAAPAPLGQGTAVAGSTTLITLQLPWMPANASARKGIAWKPSAQANLDPATSEVLLTAIARLETSSFVVMSILPHDARARACAYGGVHHADRVAASRK